MTTQERAKAIRQALKREHGWTAKHVSVRSHLYSMGSSIRIVIKDATVLRPAVERIANEHESVRRCEYSGDILSGGNRFVFVEYSEEARQAMAEPYKAPVSAAMAELAPDDDRTLKPVKGTGAHVGRNSKWLFGLWIDSRMVLDFNEHEVATAAATIARHSLETAAG